MDLGSILGSVLTGGTGGLLGVLGNCANTWLAMKQQKQQNDYQLALIPLQQTQYIEQAKADVAKVAEEGASRAFVASQEADKLDGRESPWAADVKAMVRPACLFLLGVAVVALYSAGQLTTDMKAYVIENIVTDFSMAVAWYFGARASDKVMQGFKSKAGT